MLPRLQSPCPLASPRPLRRIAHALDATCKSRAGTADVSAMSERVAEGALCFGCRHFRVTHQRDWPYACLQFELRSRRPPSVEVELASGAPCAAREPRATATDPPRADARP
jgi:hypothetical protein